MQPGRILLSLHLNLRDPPVMSFAVLAVASAAYSPAPLLARAPVVSRMAQPVMQTGKVRQLAGWQD